MATVSGWKERKTEKRFLVQGWDGGGGVGLGKENRRPSEKAVGVEIRQLLQKRSHCLLKREQHFTQRPSYDWHMAGMSPTFCCPPPGARNAPRMPLHPHLILGSHVDAPIQGGDWAFFPEEPLTCLVLHTGMVPGFRTFYRHLNLAAGTPCLPE